MSGQPRVAVVIVNYRTPELAMRCVAALAKERTAAPSLIAMVVDGGSSDGSAAMLAEALKHADYRDWAVFLPLPINGGYGWANNQAMMTLARKANAPDFFYVLNPDTEVCEGAVTSLLEELMSDPRCGAAGSLLLNPHHAPAASAFRFPSAGREFIGAAQSKLLGSVFGIEPIVVCPDKSGEVDWVTGASVMFRARALEDSGLFDDGFFLYFEEVELMHRLTARGWTIRHVPASQVMHLEGASTGVGEGALDRRLPPYWYQSRRRYFQLTGGIWRLMLANLGSVAGLAIAGLKRFAGRPPRNRSFRLVDLLRQGFWPSRGKSLPSFRRLGEMPGEPPAWMERA